MRLKVLLPTEVLVDEQVRKISAEATWLRLMLTQVYIRSM